MILGGVLEGGHHVGHGVTEASGHSYHHTGNKKQDELHCLGLIRFIMLRSDSRAAVPGNIVQVRGQ